jgi:hypothetical protein
MDIDEAGRQAATVRINDSPGKSSILNLTDTRYDAGFYRDVSPEPGIPCSIEHTRATY